MTTRRTGTALDSHRLDALLENVAFLARHGLTLEAVAARLGLTPGGLDKTLRREGRLDLVDALVANRPASLRPTKESVNL